MLGNTALFQHQHLVGNLADHTHLVGDQDDGDTQAAVNVAQQRQDGLGGLRVQCRSGLVAQQNFRPVHQRTGNAHTLLLPARQALGPGVVFTLQAHQVQQLGDALVDLRLGHTRHPQGQCHVVPHRLGRQQVEVLEDHADAAAQRHQLGLGQGADIGAVHQHPALGGLLQPVDGAQQAGLARAAAPDDAEDAARRDGQADVLQRMHRACGGVVGLADALKGHRARLRGGCIGMGGRRCARLVLHHRGCGGLPGRSAPVGTGGQGGGMAHGKGSVGASGRRVHAGRRLHDSRSQGPGRRGGWPTWPRPGCRAACRWRRRGGSRRARRASSGRSG